MSPQSQQKSIAGPLLLLFVLLADVGIGVWAWHLYQARQAKYDAAGLALAAAPPPPVRTINYAAQQAKTPPPGPERNFIKERDLDLAGRRGKRAASKPRPAQAPRPGAGDDAQARPETRQLVARAAKVYFAVKRNPRFKNSAIIQGWKRDFLAFPDLKAFDEQYRRDRDGIRFLVNMGRSPNFRLLLQKYVNTADIQAFIQEMRMHPVVVNAAQNFLKDYNLEAAARHILPAIANDTGAPDPAQAQAAAQLAPQGGDALERLKSNPALRKYLDPQDGSAPINLPGGASVPRQP